jgi:hypothetical protein
MPVDLVALAVLELAGLKCGTQSSVQQSGDAGLVYHVHNEHLFHWTTELLPALRKAGLTFETVPQRRWVDMLRKGEQDPEKNPTVKLLGFFAGKYDNDNMGRKGLVFAAEKTGKISKTIRDGYDVIGSKLIDRMVARWEEEW